MQRALPTTAPAATPRASSSPCSDGLATTIRRLSQTTAERASVVVACERSVEGVLSAVGATYLAHCPARLVRLAPADACQPMLGETVVSMPPASADACVSLAKRVYAGLERTVSKGCALSRRGACPPSCDSACISRVLYACANDSDTMPEAVHRYVRLAFSQGAAVRQMVSNPDVVAVMDLARYTLNECEHTRQFVRFSHMSDGSYVASFRPQADTLPFVASHFSARMGTERFCLVDPVHRRALLHEPGARRAVCVRLDATLAQELASRDDLASDEAYVRTMWRTLYRGLTLEGRGTAERGYDLRTSWMPKRFWGGLTELAPQVPDGAPMAIPARYQA